MLDIMYELPDKTAKEKGRYVVTPEVVRKEKSLFDIPPVPLDRRRRRSGRRKAPEASGRDSAREVAAMSTIDRPEPTTLPPLVAGQRLDQRHVPRTLRGDAGRERGPSWSEASSTCRRPGLDDHGETRR